MVEIDDDRAMYKGDEPIIFEGNPIPDHKGALESLNAHDMRGVIVKVKKGINDASDGSDDDAGTQVYSGMRVPIDMHGIVYETYKDFDHPEEYGWSIIFENRCYDGFSFEDRKEMLEIIGIYPPMQNYRFANVMQLNDDALKGKFKFR